MSARKHFVEVEECNEIGGLLKYFRLPCASVREIHDRDKELRTSAAAMAALVFSASALAVSARWNATS